MINHVSEEQTTTLLNPEAASTPLATTIVVVVILLMVVALKCGHMLTAVTAKTQKHGKFGYIQHKLQRKGNMHNCEYMHISILLNKTDVRQHMPNAKPQYDKISQNTNLPDNTKNKLTIRSDK